VAQILTILRIFGRLPFVAPAFTGCGKSRFGLKSETFRVVQNHHPTPISRLEPTVRDLFYACFSKTTFSAACSGGHVRAAQMSA
jgi:hypothetical protein